MEKMQECLLLFLGDQCKKVFIWYIWLIYGLFESGVIKLFWVI